MPGRRLGYTALAAAAAGAFLLLAAGDLALRSRGALARAEQHALWRDNPARKAAHFNAVYDGRVAGARSEAGAGRITREQAEREETLAAAERDFRMSESSAKQAYLWYRTAAEDFPSPFNPWASRAGKELPAALAAWRAELEARGARPEDWMLR